jgi:hypothetical protein
MANTCERSINIGRCLKRVDLVSKEPAKFIAVDEQSNHQIVHPFALGKADRTTYQALDSRPQIDVFAVTVGRRITPPTTASDRSMPVSVHSAPQYPDACHANLAGDSPLAPAFSHRGSVHGALAGLQSANPDGCH